MKFIHTLIIIIATMISLPALASQGSCILPTTGTLSGLTLVQDQNACNQAAQTANSGATAPSNITGGPLLGQLWLNTTAGNTLEIYDGADWLPIGVIDASNHLINLPIGGGTATIASATTTDLCSVSQSAITISGTTTITGFSNTCVPGTLKPLIFSGALILTHSSSLLLPNNGSNITTIAGDRAWAVYLGGGNWEVITYQRGDGTALSTVSVGASSLLASAQGMNAPLNLRINATVSGNALTVALKTAANADATSGTPILIPFRDATLANGDPVIGSLQAALSFTVASTNTLGTSNGIPFRLWVIGYYNGGTLAVGLINTRTLTSAGGNMFPLAENGLTSTAASTNGGNSAGTHYANVSTITNTPYRILGYLEWSSGLATAGTWASGPTSIVLFGPGIKKPGDIVQTVYFINSQSTTSSGITPTATNLTTTISPTSAMNVIHIRATGVVVGASGQFCLASIYRGTSTAIGNEAECFSTVPISVPLEAYDTPGTTSSTTYGTYIWGTGNAIWNGNTVPLTIVIDEIVSALDQSANDNINPGLFSMTG